MATYHMRGTWNSSNEARNVKHGMNVNVYNFQVAVKKLLNKQEQKDIAHVLQCYNRNRNPYYLAEFIKPLLNTPEKKSIIFLLKQIIPKTDRPSFDQFTCEDSYRCQSSHSRRSSVSHLYTNDSGIGSNNNDQDCTSKASDFSNYNHSRQYVQAPRRSSSLSDLSGKPGKSKSFGGTFGSAVRRKVRAVLARRGSSSSIELKSTMQRKYSSETKLNKLGQQSESKSFNSNQNEATTSTKHQASKDLVRIDIRRGRNNELGFTIGGGSEVGSGIFVTEVESDSPADRAGLSKGDVIIKVNEMQFNGGVSHDTAAAVLSTFDDIVMLVKPFKPPGHDAADVPWVDVHGRPSSPPRSVSKKGHYPKPVLDSRRSSVHLMQAGERKVNLTVKPRQSLGLMVRGGSEYGLGIYVTGVDRMSAAEASGLTVGDEILEVNNVRLEGATHSEAVRAIKASPILIMIVRYVGKVPQNQATSSKAPDDRISLHSSSNRKMSGKVKESKNGVRATFQRKVVNDKQMILPNKSPVHQSAMKMSSIMSALEDALLASPVWMLLSDHERHTVRYHVKEYASGNLSTNELVQALTELLNSSEKFTIMSAIRKCIDSRDLDRFDVLVLRREVETLRSMRSMQTSRNSSFLSTDTSSHLSLPSEEQSILFASDTEVQTSTPTKHDTALNVRGEKPSPSPVRPTSRPPPPPPEKHPPLKPKRTSSLTRRVTSESGSSSTTEEEFTNRGRKNKGELEHRPSSPFSIAIENHRSSHSGRVKVGNKANHPPIPSEDFFRDPNCTEEQKIEPVYSSIIKPMKNPVSDMLKTRRSSWKNSTQTSVPKTSENNVSASSILNSSSDESMYSVPHPPPQKISLRSMTFASSVNDKVTRNSQQPVNVDVHRDPSVKKTTQRFPNQISRVDHQIEKNSLVENNATSHEDDSESFLLMKDDVETQKVVVFRRANALGLVVEGGAGTKQPLPRVLRIQPGSCAQLCGRIHLGHVIHEVNGKPLIGLDHHKAVRAIARAFKQEDRDSIEFVLSGPY